MQWSWTKFIRQKLIKFKAKFSKMPFILMSFIIPFKDLNDSRQRHFLISQSFYFCSICPQSVGIFKICTNRRKLFFFRNEIGWSTWNKIKTWQAIKHLLFFVASKINKAYAHFFCMFCSHTKWQITIFNKLALFIPFLYLN